MKEMSYIADKFEELGVVPVVVLENTKDALPLAKALMEGGLPCAEVTFRTEAAQESIRLMAQEYPDMLVGAGTVLTTKQVDEAIEAVQGQIDNTGRAVDIAVNLKTEGADLDAERKIQAAQRANENRNAAKAETDILRKAEDARIALIKNSFDQQRAQRQAANARAIADIQLQLRTETNLTVKARKALNDQIVLLREQ